MNANIEAQIATRKSAAAASAEQRLKELQIKLPTPPEAFGTYVEAVQTTRSRHVGNDPNVERYDPDLWTDEFAFLSQPAKPIFKATSFSTIGRMSTPTRNGKRGCARTSRVSS
jgi:hypothetical protein